ncbi:MAG TPA: cytochrome c [Permianibacter sp.]|nr:cytochrome c [Permianibacter sp.]
MMPFVFSKLLSPTIMPVAVLLTGSLLLPVTAHADNDADIARGRYLVTITGCNDCHTPNYPQTAGKVPEAQWLTGSSLGWKGPWGVSYAANLRLSVQQHSEDAWIARAASPMLPPMPWFNLRDMDERDKRALYRYIKSLGPAGEPAPLALAPGVDAKTPVVSF